MPAAARTPGLSVAEGPTASAPELPDSGAPSEGRAASGRSGPGVLRVLCGTACMMLAGVGVPALSAPSVARPAAEATVRAELLTRVDAHFGVGELPGVAHTEGTCLTGLVEELRTHWDAFTPSERAELTARLAPWKADLFAPRAAPPAEAGLPAPPVTCFGHYLDNWEDGEHISVQYESGAITEAEAEDFLEWLEDSYDRQIGELGWWAPAGTSTYPMLVMVVNGGGASAYTTTEYCSGIGQVPYVVAYSGSFDAGDWAMTMAAHEFNHASQYSYGGAHEFWFWEASATWIEEYVYPDMNDWAQNVWLYGRYPEVGMNAWAGSSSSEVLFAHTYAMAIWNFFLDQHVGGHDYVQEIWENAASESGAYSYWMPYAIDDIRGTSFDDVYPEFLSVVAVREFDERTMFPSVDRAASVDAFPADGESRTSSAPQSLGANFIQFEKAAMPEDGYLHVRVELDDDASEWFVVLSTGNATVEQHVELEVGSDDVAEGFVYVDSAYDAHLIVSPVDRAARGPYYEWARADGFDYAWEAVFSTSDDPEVAWAGGGGSGDDGSGDDGSGDDGSGDDGSGDDGGDDGSGDDGTEGSTDGDTGDSENVDAGGGDGDKGGCSAVGAGAGAAWWLGLVLAARRRQA